MSAIQILPKIIRKQSLMSHRTTGRELRADRQEIKKAGAKPHRPFQHRSSHQCQYIRGQKQISDFGSRERSLGALTSNAEAKDSRAQCPFQGLPYEAAWRLLL
ncbi:hypothetical protein ACC699_32930 [Rhizobium ruizarguesonis]|jgi:hypothetical protein